VNAMPATALVTGSTRGLGLAIAERLCRDGVDVVANYRTHEEQARTAGARLRAIRPSARVVRADVTDEREVHRLIGETLSQSGGLDILVNNVGAFAYTPLLETGPEEWDRILRSNLTSAFLCCREAIPHMRTRGRGCIVNIASMSAGVLRATPNTLPYAIANAGVVLLTRTLARVVGPERIRVNAVCPGFIEGADFPADDPKTKIPLGRMAHPSEIADVISYLISENASYVTGAVIDVHGGALL